MRFTALLVTAIFAVSVHAQTRVYTDQEKRDSIPPKEVAVYKAPQQGQHQRKIEIVRMKPHPGLSAEENKQIMKRREQMIQEIQEKKAAGK